MGQSPTDGMRWAKSSTCAASARAESATSGPARQRRAGRARVARLYLAAARERRDAGPTTRIVELNFLPAASIRLEHPVRAQAPHALMSLGLDDDGRISRVFTTLARRKLAGLERL